MRYLQERKTSVDYTTLSGLAADIVGNFWADIEKHHPASTPSPSPADVITAWKERLATVVGVNGETRPRASSGYILLNVRSFYLDLRDWAHEDPSIVPYAVPSPVTRADATGLNRRKLHVRAKIHQRIRERVPLLPEIVAHLERELAQARALREAAAKAPLDDLLTVDGRSYVREDGYVKAARVCRRAPHMSFVTLRPGSGSAPPDANTTRSGSGHRGNPAPHGPSDRGTPRTHPPRAGLPPTVHHR